MRRTRSGLVAANDDRAEHAEQGGQDEEPQLHPGEEERTERDEGDDHRRAHVVAGHDGGEHEHGDGHERDARRAVHDPRSVCLRNSTYPTHSARVSLRNSEGCAWSPATTIQLRLPFASTPMPGTKTSSWKRIAAISAGHAAFFQNEIGQAARDEHQRDAEHGEHRLLEHGLIGRLARRGRGRRCRREDHHQAEPGQQQRRRGDEQELARDRREHLAERHAGGEAAAAVRVRRDLGPVGSARWSCSPSVPPAIRSLTAAAKRRASVGVGRELIEGCGGGGEQHDVPVTRDPGRQFDDPCHDILSLSGVHLEHGHRGRVSRERRDDRRAIDADHDRGLRAGPATGDEVGDVDALQEARPRPTPRRGRPRATMRPHAGSSPWSRRPT